MNSPQIMNSVINPEYSTLEAEFQKAIKSQLPVDKVFCNKRNTVELVTIAGRKMVVKRYRRQGLFNRFIYTFFRKSKARRAYEYALMLNEKGFHSPTPIAYFEESKSGLFSDGYFISEYISGPSVLDLFYGDSPLPFDSPKRALIAAKISDLTLRLHLGGIQPLDYNMSNILVENPGSDENMRFWLIDLNRMKVGKVPAVKQAMLSFFQLGTYYPDYAKLLEPYASARGWDVETCIYRIIRHRRAFNRLRKLKQFFKRRFK